MEKSNKLVNDFRLNTGQYPPSFSTTRNMCLRNLAGADWVLFIVLFFSFSFSSKPILGKLGSFNWKVTLKNCIVQSCVTDKVPRIKFKSLLRSVFFFQLDECLLFLLTSFLKRSVLFMDELYQLRIWNYWRCVKKRLSWWLFYLETSYPRLENSCLSRSSSNFVFLDYLNYP